MIKLKIVVILFLLVHIAHAETFDFKTDSTSYLIGQQAKFKLSYEGKEDFSWPMIKDTLSKDLEIIECSNIDTIAPGKYEQSIYITAWDSGYFVIPPIISGNTQTAPSLIRFNSVPVNPQEDIKPIKKQMNTPWIFAESKKLIFTVLIILIVIGGASAIAFYQLKKRNRKTEVIIPARPLIEVLWERYHALAESKIWETGQEKEFQSELSLILRSFLEFKHKIKALEETTGNITTQLNSLGLDRKFRDEVSHILNFSDMVKFAKQKGVFSQHERAINALKEILESHQEEIG